MSSRSVIFAVLCTAAVSLALCGCERAGDQVTAVDEVACDAACAARGEDGTCLASCEGPAEAGCETGATCKGHKGGHGEAAVACEGHAASSGEALAACSHKDCTGDCPLHGKEGGESACAHASECAEAHHADGHGCPGAAESGEGCPRLAAGTCPRSAAAAKQTEDSAK
jgi:hypothetical protein